MAAPSPVIASLSWMSSRSAAFLLRDSSLTSRFLRSSRGTERTLRRNAGPRNLELVAGMNDNLSPSGTARDLFDHLVGAENQRRWDAEVEGLGRL